MAYTGNDPYEKKLYEKYLEAGLPDESANLLARLPNELDGRVRSKWDVVKEQGVSGFVSWLKCKL